MTIIKWEVAMMQICHNACAGTLESSDVLVEIEPCDNGVELEIQSVVYEQFGQNIEQTVRDLLQQFAITEGRILLNDRGALECTIRARLETALKRAGRGEAHA